MVCAVLMASVARAATLKTPQHSGMILRDCNTVTRFGTAAASPARCRGRRQTTAPWPRSRRQPTNSPPRRGPPAQPRYGAPPARLLNNRRTRGRTGQPRQTRFLFAASHDHRPPAHARPRPVRRRAPDKTHAPDARRTRRADRTSPPRPWKTSLDSLLDICRASTSACSIAMIKGLPAASPARTDRRGLPALKLRTARSAPAPAPFQPLESESDPLLERVLHNASLQQRPALQPGGAILLAAAMRETAGAHRSPRQRLWHCARSPGSRLPGVLVSAGRPQAAKPGRRSPCLESRHRCARLADLLGHPSNSAQAPAACCTVRLPRPRQAHHARPQQPARPRPPLNEPAASRWWTTTGHKPSPA